MNPVTASFVSELKREATATRHILSGVPLEQSDWQPHVKSMKLGRLASHVADLLGWVSITLEQDELDFATADFKHFVPTSTEELLAYFEAKLSEAQSILANCTDVKLDEHWTMRSADQIYFTQPKGEVLRHWCFNHLVHHRAQLGVYLRLLDVVVPMSYGPTADHK